MWFGRLVFIIILITQVSCTYILRSYIGIKNPKELSDQQIIKQANKFGISQSDLWKIDTSKYKVFINSIADSAARKDRLQPLQILAFDSTGEKHLHLINCYVGGIPKITWNSFNSFDHFPLAQNECRFPSLELSLKQEVEMLVPINALVMDGNIYRHDEIIIVHWSRYFNRRSKELIGFVKDYKKRNPNKDIHVLYVNNDNIYGSLLNWAP